MNQLQAAGYIVENGEAIWGKGATSDEAWQDFLARMKIANVEVVMELQTDAGGFPEPDQTLASDYRITSPRRRRCWIRWSGTAAQSHGPGATAWPAPTKRRRHDRGLRQTRRPCAISRPLAERREGAQEGHLHRRIRGIRSRRVPGGACVSHQGEARPTWSTMTCEPT